MGQTLDYSQANAELADRFRQAEQNFSHEAPASINQTTSKSIKALFESSTQAYREALLGCCLARLANPDIDLTSPYANQGELAYNGRSLDEKVVNPFLKEQAIPCSNGPFLSVFRRNVKFDQETGKGVRDKQGYEAMLLVIEELQSSTQEEAELLLAALLHEFVALRERSAIDLTRITKLSLEQCRSLIEGLVQTKSGGLLPVLVTMAALQAMIKTFSLTWNVEFQDINVADTTQGAGGDITIQQSDQVLLSIEVTERMIDDDRVRSIFQSKISPQKISDYLFLHTASEPTEAAREFAKSRFPVGYEINFMPITEWVVPILSATGIQGRTLFLENLIELLSPAQIPATLKVAWNQQLERAIAWPEQ